MAEVICPECRRPLSVPPGAKEGDILACPFCAGVSLRLANRDGSWKGRVVRKASCALCGEEVLLPDAVKPGDIIEHCGRRQMVSLEYGAYALEPI